MIKLTRLNRSIVAVNPDHISWVDASPDTTLCLLGGDKLIVRETIDELIDRFVEFRRLVRATPSGRADADLEGDPPPPDVIRAIRRPPSRCPPRTSTRPPGDERNG